MEFLIKRETTGPWSQNTQSNLPEEVCCFWFLIQKISLFLAGGGQYQGLCLKPPAPPLRAGSWERGFFEGLPCAAGDFGWGLGVGWGPLLSTRPIPSNLGQHFTLISCRAKGSCLWGPLGCCGGPSSPFHQGPAQRQGTGREPTCRRCCKPTRGLSRWAVLEGGASFPNNFPGVGAAPAGAFVLLCADASGARSGLLGTVSESLRLPPGVPHFFSVSNCHLPLAPQ